jgi:hypothetical protein
MRRHALQREPPHLSIGPDPPTEQGAIVGE